MAKKMKSAVRANAAKLQKVGPVATLSNAKSLGSKAGKSGR